MKKIKGFTLIELIVAILLIAVISIAAFEFFRYCQQFVISSESRLMAINYARETMEDIYWNAGLTNGTYNVLMPSNSVLVNAHSGSGVYTVDNSLNSTYDVYTVTVTWD